MFGSVQIVGVAGVPPWGFVNLWGHYFLEALFAGLLVQLRLALSCLTSKDFWGLGVPPQDTAKYSEVYSFWGCIRL